jgi:hypothetical protein
MTASGRRVSNTTHRPEGFQPSGLENFWKTPDDWERRAIAAATDPEHLECCSFLRVEHAAGSSSHYDYVLKSHRVLKRFVAWFATGLGPGQQPKLINLITHLALNAPALPFKVEQAILRYSAR